MFRHSFLPFKIESKIHKSQYVLRYFKIPYNTLILNEESEFSEDGGVKPMFYTIQ